MDILVYIDEDDKKLIKEVAYICDTQSEKCLEEYNKFWTTMVSKYPVLKNERISINARDGFIFRWYSHADFKHANLGTKESI